ncbi:hypothetical protein G6F46_007392 [Rhizopus delemar]|uniref:Myb-like domain-containing protein n=3 Tax=Rhizopus TaxID=4842 RepID=I1BI70_RHIO9|nr:hypothetical protein RO3G_00604 [Rhizopus delemar RA 99-880]KAG1457104.1 hypothetical protein G6F55_006122 [Rhizopus delemar]KAG1546874.1 hypothetical protein G6F51_004616 [Rhizopus arrhizus]KAG1501817.1 hypothetical protein G6F54_002784 [Rhizopus delemar]KAG1514748.1 hypothetical protein G6F53_003438 [Rhizopus delemar]|eukprot:EIE75900.1 hypothetical protein RO3G_00604 [Rhizopus delemar RA 99-880]
MEHCQESPKVVLPPIRYYDPFDQPFTYSNSEFAVYKKLADDTHHFDSTTLLIHPLDSSSSKSLDSTDFTRPIHLFTENELVRRKRRSCHAFEQRNLTNNDQINLGYHVPRVATATPRFRRFTRPQDERQIIPVYYGYHRKRYSYHPDTFTDQNQQQHIEEDKKDSGKKKPRWSMDDRAKLISAIIKDKKLDDMTTFDWDSISSHVNRGNKACKDQWRREILPVLQRLPYLNQFHPTNDHFMDEAANE